MKPSRLVEITKVLVAARKPVMWKGRPGGGKTEMAEQIGRDLKMKLVVWHPITWDVTDAKGLPVQVELPGGKRGAEFVPYGDLRVVMEAKVPTLVIIDDFGQASASVQAAIMHPVLARRINGHKVSDHVTFIVLTNRREDKAAVTGIISPFVDRMVGVYQLDPDGEDWVQWGLTHGVPVELLAFIRLRPNFITDYIPNRDIVKTPSPRSIYELGEALKLGLTQYDAIEGMVGGAMAQELCAFLATLKDMPDREEIISNPKSAPVPASERPDVLFALMGALAYIASPENFGAIGTYLDRLPPEFAVVAIKDAITRRPALKATATYTQFVTKHTHLYGMAA